MPFPIKQAIDHISHNKTTQLRGLSTSTSALFIANLTPQLNKPIIIVTANDKISHQLANDLNFFNAPKPLVIDTIDANPYTGLAPNKLQLASRCKASYLLLESQPPTITIASIQALARKTIPPEDFICSTHRLEINQELNLDNLKTTLLSLAYTSESEAEVPGTFAFRGAIIDIFSTYNELPYRIELFGDTIEEIKFFDPQTQRTISKTDHMLILPASEVILNENTLANARKTFMQCADRQNLPSSILQNFLDKLAQQTHFYGIESLFPAFYTQNASLFDYLPENSLYFWAEPDLSKKELLTLTQNLDAHFKMNIEDDKIALPPTDFFLSFEQIKSKLLKHELVISGLTLELQNEINPTPETIWLENTDNRFIKQQKDNAQHHYDHIKSFKEQLPHLLSNYPMLLCTASTKGTIERLKSILNASNIKTRTLNEPFNFKHQTPDTILLYQATLSSGFKIPELGLAIISENEIFGTRTHRQTSAKKLNDARTLDTFKDLKIGDFVVHEEHGIGKYLGLITLQAGGLISDFLHIGYAGKDKLYIPVHRLNCIQKYAGAEQPRKIDKLGGGAWERTKEKVRQDVTKLAINLLDLYAQRLNQKGFAFSAPDPYFKSFEASFPFDETEEQAQAIEDVLNDMQKPQPMERLVCGDVGFGKTEVAMRAAFRAVLDTKQVAILVPTTILAEQHYESFKERFAAYPVTIEVLNRFKKTKQVNQILKDLNDGKIDIIIGTHRLLSKDVAFKDLGLLVIDEEHRFGVTHKEKIKELAVNIDCLMLTATPIPRTFQMCVGGLKDISLISTPPQDRLAIHTHVAKFNETLIKDAITKELERNGQVYFLHNKIEELNTLADKLKQLVPLAKIETLHGQMPSKDIETTLNKFIHREINLLLCTTIIESGLDIPQANCLFVNHADHFGLAQLYQIRGRVGRSSRRAYCYLLIDDENKITDIARERLNAIEKHTQLGSGSEIAYLDMEMRGSGNLLGSEQSGNILSVGLEMYAELMQEAIAELQGKQLKSKLNPDLKFPFSARLPEEYITDVQLRLLFYKRLASSENDTQLFEIFAELTDRFGTPPQEALNLRDTFQIKLRLKQLNIKSIDINATTIILDLNEDCTLNPDKILDMVLQDQRRYQLRNDFKLIRYLSKNEANNLVFTTLHYLENLISLSKSV